MKRQKRPATRGRLSANASSKYSIDSAHTPHRVFKIASHKKPGHGARVNFEHTRFEQLLPEEPELQQSLLQ